MSSTDLAKNVASSGTLVPVDQKFGDDVFGEIASSGKWLPRLQLFGSNTGEVTEGKIGVAHYGLASGKDNLIDLGKEVDCLPIAWRPKAMDISDINQIITEYDHTSAGFKRIVVQSEVRDSGCMFGPEYLVWIPSQMKFSSFFCNNKTSRRAAPALKERLGKPTTIKAELIKTPKYTWHGPVFLACSTPFDLPTNEALAEEVERFNNPAKSDVEKVEAAPSNARPR